MKYWLMIIFISSQAYATPIEHLTKLGEGEMSYLFWTLYQAELYGTNQQVDLKDQDELALKIIYQKTISSKALVDATKDQWQKLNYTSEEIDKWLKPLTSLFPDVQKKDSLLLKLDSQGQSQFFLNLEPIGVIKDTTFGPAFMAIWLSENTSEPKLRKQLLGLSQ